MICVLIDVLPQSNIDWQLYFEKKHPLIWFPHTTRLWFIPNCTPPKPKLPLPPNPTKWPGMKHLMLLLSNGSYSVKILLFWPNGLFVFSLFVCWGCRPKPPTHCDLKMYWPPFKCTLLHILFLIHPPFCPSPSSSTHHHFIEEIANNYSY